MSFPVHHVELHQRKDQSGPDNCRPECPAPIHHKVLQQKKDQSSPDKFRFESPPLSITRNCNTEERPVRSRQVPSRKSCPRLSGGVSSQRKDQSDPDNCRPESPARKIKTVQL
ncbi:hypothetical protein TNCV_3137971 [Trichonephila clavipes]|nr:hypothetical protein TNCV_3137971 [Trichonephila clavipes]